MMAQFVTVHTHKGVAAHSVLLLAVVLLAIPAQARYLSLILAHIGPSQHRLSFNGYRFVHNGQTSIHSG